MTSSFLRYVRRHHVALLALFLALGGTSYAAVSALVPKNSVGSAQVINGSLQKLDLSKKAQKALRGARGPRGLQGAQGVQGVQGVQGTPGAQGVPGNAGAPGSAIAYAHINGSGAVDAANSKNVASGNVTKGLGLGLYCLHDLGFTPHNPVASVGFAGTALEIVVGLGASGGCGAGTQVSVLTLDGTNTATDNDFFIGFN
jgi:hypothetical protein